MPPTSESDYPDDMKAPSYVVDGERYRSLIAERDGLREALEEIASVVTLTEGRRIARLALAAQEEER